MPNFDESENATRRDLVKGGLAVGAMLGLGMAGGDPAAAAPSGDEAADLPLDSVKGRGDVAILRFLAAAELIEHDLWQQYAELGENNTDYREALEAIDDDMVDYIVDTTEDELSHHEFINAFLAENGATPVNLDQFRTILPPPVDGIEPRGRLTNLTKLSIDTSYYERYRSKANPDFGATFPQIATIVRQPAIPTSNGIGADALGGIARVAAFHFASIEVGGTSLYNSFLPKATRREVLRIVGSIYGTEAIHYAIFEDTFGGISAFQNDDGTLVVPDLTGGKHGSAHVMPRRCLFRRGLPTCSVIRPGSTKHAGAVAAVNALRASHLFAGQSPEFFQTLKDLAHEADAAFRDL